MALIITNVALFFSLIHDAFENNVYDLSLFTIFVGYNLSVSMVIIGILVFKFIAWRKSNRNISIFLYGLALAIFFLTTTSAMRTLLLYAESVFLRRCRLGLIHGIERRHFIRYLRSYIIQV